MVRSANLIRKVQSNLGLVVGLNEWCWVGEQTSPLFHQLSVLWCQESNGKSDHPTGGVTVLLQVRTTGNALARSKFALLYSQTFRGQIFVERVGKFCAVSKIQLWSEPWRGGITLCELEMLSET